MLGNYSLGANCVDRCIPDIVGINDYHRTVSTLIHAAGVVHSHFIAKPRCGNGFLENCVNFGRPRERARLSAGADEHVMTVLSHPGNLPIRAARYPLTAKANR